MGTGSCYFGTVLLVAVINLIRITTCSSILQPMPKSVVAKSELDTEESRRVLGSSVVTSVSVVMNHGNETQTYFTNKMPSAELKANPISSPGNLLNPDKYEFYTFDGTGDLVKRLMTWEEIQGLIAGSDTDNVLSDAIVPIYYNENTAPDKIDDTHLTANEFQSSDVQDVRKVVESVQNVLKSELAASQSKILPIKQPTLLSNSPNWSLLLPNLFENVDDDGVADLHHLSNTLTISTRNSSSLASEIVGSNGSTNKNHSNNYFDDLVGSTISDAFAASTTWMPTSKNSAKTTFAQEIFKKTEKPAITESVATKTSLSLLEKIRPQASSSSTKYITPSTTTTSSVAVNNAFTTTSRVMLKKNSTTPQYDFYTSHRDLFTAITNLLNQVNGQHSKIEPTVDAFKLTNYEKHNSTTYNTKPSFFANENANIPLNNYYQNHTERYTIGYDLPRATTEHDVAAQQAFANTSNGESTVAEIFKYGTYFTKTTTRRHDDDVDKTTTPTSSIHDLSTRRKQSSTSTMKSIFHAQSALASVSNNNHHHLVNTVGDESNVVASSPHKYAGAFNFSQLSEAKTTTPITSVEPLVTWTSAYSSNEFQDDNVENNEISDLEKLVTEQYVSGSNEKPWFLKATENNYTNKNNTATTNVFTFSPFAQSTVQPQDLFIGKITPTHATAVPIDIGDQKKTTTTSDHRPHFAGGAAGGNRNNQSYSNASTSAMTDTKTTTYDHYTSNFDVHLHRIPTIDADTYVEAKTESSSSSSQQHKYSTFSSHHTRPSNSASLHHSVVDSSTTRSSPNKHPQYVSTTAAFNTYSSATLSAETEIEMQRIPTIDPHNKTNTFQTNSDTDRVSSTKSSYVSPSSTSPSPFMSSSLTESSVKNLTQIAIMLNKSNDTTKYSNKNADTKHKFTIKPSTAATLNYLSTIGATDSLVNKYHSSTARPIIGQNGSFSPYLNDCIASLFSTSSSKISGDGGDKNDGSISTATKTDNRIKNTNQSDQEIEMKTESSFQNLPQQKWPLSDTQKENSHIYYYKLPPITSPQASNTYAGGGSSSSGSSSSSSSSSTSTFLDTKIKNDNRTDYTINGNKTTAAHRHQTMIHQRRPNPTLASPINSTIPVATSEPTDKRYEIITTVQHPQHHTSLKTIDAVSIKTNETYHAHQDVTQNEILRNGLSTVASHLLQTEARQPSKYPIANVTPYQQEKVLAEYLQNREAFEENTFTPDAGSSSPPPKNNAIVRLSSTTTTDYDNHRIVEKNNDANKHGNYQTSDSVDAVSAPWMDESSSTVAAITALHTSFPPIVVQVHKSTNDRYNATASPTSITKTILDTSKTTTINDSRSSNIQRVGASTALPPVSPFSWSSSTTTTTTMPTHHIISESVFKNGQFVAQNKNATTTTKDHDDDNVAEKQIPYYSKTVTTTTELPAVKNYGSWVDERYKYSGYHTINRTQNFKNTNNNNYNQHRNSTISYQQQSNDTTAEKIPIFNAINSTPTTTMIPLVETNTSTNRLSYTQYNSTVITTTTPLGAGHATYQSASSLYDGTSETELKSESGSVETKLKDAASTSSKIVAAAAAAAANVDIHEKSTIDDVAETNKSASAISINTYSTSIPYQTGVFRSPFNSSSVRTSTTAPNAMAGVELHPAPHENMGLEASLTYLGDDVKSFVDLCNELSFKTWTTLTAKSSTTSRSMVLSPFALISNLAMIFLGARGSSSGIMNDLLRLDDMVTFNPHQVLRNITESTVNGKNTGVANAAFVRQIFSDKSKGNVLEFYKERLQQYYDTHIEEINFNVIGDLVRRRTNLLVKRQTQGRIQDYLKGSALTLKPPLAALTTNIFQTNCDAASTDGRDGEMYFVVRPSNRQRRLIPIPAVVYHGGFLAGYEPGLDATAVTLSPDSIISTVLVLPGQQGQVAPGDGLARLEQRLLESSYRRGAWSRLLRSLLFRQGLEVQLPRFSHKSVLNLTLALQKMGLNEIFSSDKADLRGINGLPNQLHLSDIVQLNTFSMCGEETVGARHHIEIFPSISQRLAKNQRSYAQNNNDYSAAVPLNLRPRQARLPDNPRLRFDRPFLYLVRHNPSGMILYIGRFNPRLLP